MPAADLLRLLESLSDRLQADLSQTSDDEGGEAYQLTVPVGDEGRTQDVMFILVESEDGEPLVRAFSIGGPLPERGDLYGFLLKQNASLDYGCYGIMEVEGVDMLVTLETRTLANVNVDELARGVHYIALIADEAEEQINSEDRF